MMRIGESLSQHTGVHLGSLSLSRKVALGQMGHNAGEFFGLHMEAVDSKGNIYTGEVFGGERVQKFVPVK
jgi:hypothetical protein